MESLCTRARAVMNLILLAVILQTWIILSDRPDLSDYVDEMCEAFAGLGRTPGK
jgi:hypothetical protein